MEDIFENWDVPPSLPDMDRELKAMRRNLRRRNWKIILTSILLVMAILFASVRYGIPALESRYWDPTVCTYLEDVTDLELTMATYTELFGHGRHFGAVDIQKQGFATYSLDTIFVEWKNLHSLTNLFFRNGTLERDEVILPTNFWLDTERGFIIRSLSSENVDFVQGRNAQTEAVLKTLPEYIQILAGVTFSEDQTMDQLCELIRTDLSTTRFLWAVLRNDPEAEYFSRCGVHLTSYQYERYSPSFWRNSDYPHLFFDTGRNGSYLEEHVTSMLRFSADQFRAGTGFSPSEDDTYYQKTLNYMEENGIQSYGAYVIATPSALLDMLEDGTAACISLIDAEIGI